MALYSRTKKTWVVILCAEVFDSNEVVMSCYSPLRGYASRSLSVNGKRQIVFDRSAGFVDMPMTVPCGVCIGCRIDKSRTWALRCVHEAKLHARNSFLTLTYSPECLPSDLSLSKIHLQKFFKRLRKSHGSFRYFAVGEYGDNLCRPHYHVILFGLDFADDRKYYKPNKKGDPLYTSPSLEATWGLGFVTIGQFSYATAAYTARYVMKKVKGKTAAEHYTRLNPDTGEIFELLPEFCCMSLKPGIGSGWYEKFHTDVFPSDFLVHDGKKHTVPRYYYDKLARTHPSIHSGIKLKRKLARIENASNNTPDRLSVREECKLSQIKVLKRDL